MLHYDWSSGLGENRPDQRFERYGEYLIRNYSVVIQKSQGNERYETRMRQCKIRNQIEAVQDMKPD